MSVNTSEEYLDELLQAIEPIIYMNEPEPVAEPTPEPIVEPTPEPVVEPIMDSTVAEETNIMGNLLDSFTEIPVQEPVISATEESPMPEAEIDLAHLAEMENNSEDAVSMNDLLASLAAESDVVEGAEEALDIDAMLKAAADTASSMSDTSVSHDEDVKALLQQFTDDEDLSDIGDILERNDNSEAVDESMLETPEVEVFQLEEENPEIAEEKKESKGIFGFLKKKKGKKKKDKVAETEMSELPVADAEAETLEILEDADESVPEEVAQTTTEELLPDETFDDLAGIDLFGLEAGGESFSEAGEENVDLSSMSLDDIFAEGDMTDIDQLLSAGSFGEAGLEIEDPNGELASIEERPSGKKKKSDKKETFFSKIFTMLTEEDEEEPTKGNVPEAEATGVTDENVAILSELSKEDKKKAKKEKKEQRKKAKEEKKKGKSATEGEAEDDGGEGNEDGEGDKKGKKEKKKKVKKEKPRKVVDIDEKPPKKLSRKKVTTIFAFCFTILAMILIMQNVLLDLSNVKEAKKAFDNADYETCYANLYGVERSEEEEEIYQKSYIILAVQRKWDSYQNFRQLGMDVEALDALFEGVRVYRSMEDEAESLRILDRITNIYREIYDELKNYGLTDADIEEILAYESKVSYTKRLDSIVNGTPFVIDSVPEEAIVEEAVEESKPLEDVLPQEEDFLPEDTSLIYEMNQTEPMLQNQVTEGGPVEEQAQEVQPVEEQGNTVVVGSNPVNINGTALENAGGVNVGNGDTNITATVDGNGSAVSGF